MLNRLPGPAAHPSVRYRPDRPAVPGRLRAGLGGLTPLELRTYLGLDYVADIRDFLAPGYTQYSGPQTGTDITPAIDAAADYLRTNYGRGIIYIPPGAWRMASGANHTKLAGLSVQGAGSQASRITFDANTGSMFRFSGAGGYSGGGMKGLTLRIDDGYAASTSIAIHLQGDASYQPDQTMFEDLYITAIGTSYWYQALYINGMGRTSPQGIRETSWNNIQLFRSSNLACYMANACGLDMINVGTYSGTGTGNDFQISGGGASDTNTTQVDIRLAQIGGRLNISECSDVSINAKVADITVATTATYVTLEGHYSGTVTGTLGTAGFNRMNGLVADVNLPTFVKGALVVVVPVNLNAVADTVIPIQLPVGFTKYRLSAVQLFNNGTTASLTTARAGLFSAVAGGGVALVADGVLSGITSNAVNTANNGLTHTVAVTTARWLDYTTLYYRVSTAQGAAASGYVHVTYVPIF